MENYDDFCLETKLLYRFFLLGKSLNPKVFPSHVDVYDGIRLLDGEDKELINQLIQEESNNKKEYCILFNAKRNIYLNHTYIKSSLLKDIIKSVIIPDFTFLIEDDVIYLNLEGFDDFYTIYQYTYIQVLDHIYKLYSKGVVKLETESELSLIKKWDLIPVSEGLYSFRRFDPRMVNKKASLFLEEKKRGIDYITVKIPNNNLIKHYIAEEFNRRRRKFCFLYDEMLIWVNDIINSELCLSYIDEAVSNSSGYVKTDFECDFTIKDGKYVSYYDLYYGIVRSSLQ